MVFVAIDRTVWVDASGLKLRSEPSTESEIIKTLSRYTKLRCSGVSDKWFEVTTEDGDEGFVYISYTTEKAPPTPTPKPTSAPKSGGKTSKTGNTATLPTITGVNGESVVNVCISMLGVEYKWNGESRDGVDCSGLVVYAYRQVGVGGLPHQSNSLKSYGVSIARSDIKLGDVVCYDIRGSADSVEHVGIYAGGNQVIHASSTRDQVEYGSLDMYPIVSIRRIIQ
jgi:cell wall-associated NlpC family hydrolase